MRLCMCVCVFRQSSQCDILLLYGRRYENVVCVCVQGGRQTTSIFANKMLEMLPEGGGCGE